MANPNVVSMLSWVYTDNLSNTVKFYENILGLKSIRRTVTARIFEVTSTASIGVCQVFDNRVVEPRGGMISIVVEDADNWYEVIRTRGCVPECAPYIMESFEIYTFFIRDPNGYVIEFQQFLH